MRGQAAPKKGSEQHRANTSKSRRENCVAAAARGQVVSVQAAARRELTRNESGASRLQVVRSHAVRARAQSSSFFQSRRNRDQVVAVFVTDLGRVGPGNHIHVPDGQALGVDFGFYDYTYEYKDKRRICGANPQGLCTTTVTAKSQLANYLKEAGCKVVTTRKKNENHMDIYHIALHGGPSGHDDAGKIRALSCTKYGSGRTCGCGVHGNI